MKQSLNLAAASRCVRCGICKTQCPTYLTTHNETMGARGRVAMLGEMDMKRLAPTGALATMIFSCMLCGACKNLCPTGINIPELIYQGRTLLRDSYGRGRLFRTALKVSLSRLDSVFALLRGGQKLLYRPLYRAGIVEYIPEITATPFKQKLQVYKNIKKTGRIAVFAGCSVNYFYPRLGEALSRIMLSKGYEVVVFRGEVCCGAPFRSMGLETEALKLAERNIDHFNKVRAQAIISMCPTCTMVMREQYPALTGKSITNIMDVNEFLDTYSVATGLETGTASVTYHDPCHLSYGLSIRDKPRNILRSVKGIELVELKNADECCGFAGLFSMQFKSIARTIGRKKIKHIADTQAETVVTSCPGCIMQLEALKRETRARFKIKHIVEVVDEAMHGQIPGHHSEKRGGRETS